MEQRRSEYETIAKIEKIRNKNQQHFVWWKYKDIMVWKYFARPLNGQALRMLRKMGRDRIYWFINLVQCRGEAADSRWIKKGAIYALWIWRQFQSFRNYFAHSAKRQSAVLLTARRLWTIWEWNRSVPSCQAASVHPFIIQIASFAHAKMLISQNQKVPTL